MRPLLSGSRLAATRATVQQSSVPALTEWVLALTLLLLFAFNRGLSKVHLGSLYLFDLLIILYFPLVVKNVFDRPKKFAPAIILLALASSWIVIEWGSGDLSAPAIRRYAFAIYLFTPALIGAVGTRYYRLIRENPGLLAIAVALASFSWISPETRGTVSSQSLGLLVLVAVLISPGAKRGRLQICIAAIAFALVVSGYTSDESPYRTPMAGLIGAGVAVTLWVMLAKRVGRRFRRTVLKISVAGALFGSVILTFTSPGAQLMAAAAGLVGGSATHLQDDTRGRGDASGTAETRTAFWLAVIKGLGADTTTALVGNGHQFSFFERTRPYTSFVDEELLEPHNSFIAAADRYGLVGVACVSLLLWNFRARNGTPRERAFSIACYVLALVYASFEVVLEVPHGAVVFWTIWLAPSYCLARPPQ